MEEHHNSEGINEEMANEGQKDEEEEEAEVGLLSLVENLNLLSF